MSEDHSLSLADVRFGNLLVRLFVLSLIAYLFASCVFSMIAWADDEKGFVGWMSWFALGRLIMGIVPMMLLVVYTMLYLFSGWRPFLMFGKKH